MIVRDFYSIFDVMRFPAGETHVEAKYQVPDGTVIVMADCRGFEQLGNLLTAAQICKQNGVKDLTWFVPYFPFGRHDRRRNPLDGMELTLAMEMVKDLNIVTLDPHSDVLGQMRHIPQAEVVRYLSTRPDYVYARIPDQAVFVIPDNGATKKAYTWLDPEDEFYQGLKKRDPRTGNLSGFGVQDCPPGTLNGKEVVIVDDICDGGGTFLGLLAEIRKDHTPKTVDLVVAHGLFTAGTKKMTDAFNKVINIGPAPWEDGVASFVTGVAYDDFFLRTTKV